MCGIAGIFDPDELPDERSLSAMNACLEHRGPDDTGIHVDDPIALTHQRLAVIDPDKGRQPLFNEDRSICVVFNGELYNHRALRSTLEDTGHTFSTDADTEVLVHGYEQWGDEVTERVEGMFAAALWDSNRERLLLARDPMGIKPLLLASGGTRIAFASELPALFELNLDLGGLDRDGLAQYFGMGFIPAPKTAFGNVSKLRPGERVVVTENGIQGERYHLPTVNRHEPGIAEAARQIRGRVIEAVEKRLMADVPLGAFLSGGLDSSIIVAVMAGLMDEPVQTFTVGFEEHLFDESWAAREVAEYHGTDHHEYRVSPDEVRELVPAVIDRLGEPFADPSILPTYVVARETSRDVTVALSGDGADELFAGYNKYLGEQYSGYYRALPRTVRKGIERIVSVLPARRDRKSGEFARQAQKFLRGSEADSVNRHFEWIRLPDDCAIEVFVAPDETSDPIRSSTEALAGEHQAMRTRFPVADEFSRMLAVDTHFVLPNQLLTKVDLAGMYNSLEVRVPFLDTALVRYAQSLPAEYKIDGRTRKRVLRRAFDDFLPPVIKERGKQGFEIPIGEWFKGPLAAEFESVLGGIESPLVDTRRVRSIYEQHCTGRRDHTKFLWSVYVFGRWERRMRERGVLVPEE